MIAASESSSERALHEARLWLGTPYQHQASLRGVGCDCLGLVRGVWRALHGAEPEAPPPYRPDWAELGGRELLREALGRSLAAVDLAEARPGDVLLFRMAPGAPAKHCAILSGPDRMIHAYWGRACVESWLGRWWRERCVAAFRFPEISDAKTLSPLERVPNDTLDKDSSWPRSSSPPSEPPWADPSGA